MSTLNRLLLRELGRLRGQAITIALVVAAGVAAHVALLSAWSSLHASRDRFYDEQRFGDVFASLERAPLPVADQLLEIPGVATVQTRIVRPARVPIEGISQPPTAQLVSLPDEGPPSLGALVVQEGRLPERGRADEAALLTKFALAQGIEVGDELPVVVDGLFRRLKIVGLVASPEFLYTVPVGELSPDDERHAVLWLRRSELERLVAMEGAFDDVVLALSPGASEAAVLDEVDRVLRPYGGLGAMGRAKQPSNETLEGEMLQLRSLASVLPPIFLLVAAFLMNVVLSRLVLLQRGQIATLKAVGYPDRRIGLHYLGLVSLVSLAGGTLGTLLGWYLGAEMSALYARVFGFPSWSFELPPAVVVSGLAVGLLSAALGAFVSVRQVTRLQPAEAMQPAAPARYRRTLLERLGFDRLMGTPSRMVMRELGRHPVRTLLSVVAIALSVSVLVMGRFFLDAVDELLELQFGIASREDLAVAFETPVPLRAVRALGSLPGVLDVEALRAVPVRFSSGPRRREGMLTGFEPHATLRRPVDLQGRVPKLPLHGALVSTKLAEALRVGPGDTLRVEVKEGERRTIELPVAGLVDDAVGLQGYLRLEALLELLGEQDGASTALLDIDPDRQDDVEHRLAEMPAVLSVSSRRVAFERFQDQLQKTIVITTLIVTLFAATIAVGVVYNDARVALATRERDLASLRVMGFTRREISEVLLGEIFLRFVLAIVPGLLLGRWLSALVAGATDPERLRLPVVISGRTDAFAVTVALVAALASALLVRRRLDELDLTSVLKSRE